MLTYHCWFWWRKSHSAEWTGCHS